MKKWVVFLLGFISGIAFIVVVALLSGGKSHVSDNGMTFFDVPGECLSANQFEVMQGLPGNCALAFAQKEYGTYLGYMNTDFLVLVTNDTGEPYYDKQVIKVPEGKCMRQVGIYRYQTNSEIWKTVPIVKLMDK